MALEGEYAPLKHKPWICDHVEVWERSGGLKGTNLAGSGEPCVIIVNRGSVSGQLHRTPVIKVEREGQYAAVGSKAGGPKDPAWVANVRADPRVELWDGPARGDYTARELNGDERRDWWDRAVAAFPTYAEYQAMTERVIPVFLLAPSAGLGRSHGRHAPAQVPPGVGGGFPQLLLASRRVSFKFDVPGNFLHLRS